MIYFGYLLFLILMLAIERYSVRFSPIIRILIPIVYALFIGLRGKYVGVDTEAYYDHFYTFGRWGCDFVEPGFDWINRVLFGWGYNANAFFLANAMITLFFIYLALNRLDRKRYTYTAFCMYMLTFTFLVNGMRQGIACGIFVFAYQFIEERKPIHYCLSLLFASLFHASALFLIPLYFLEKKHLSQPVYIGLFVFSFIGLFVDISSYIPAIELGTRDYSRYVENANKAQASSLGFIITTILNILVLALMLKNRIHERYSLLFNLVFLSFLLKNLGYSLPIIGRVAIYFTWFVYFLYPIVLSKKSRPLFNNIFVTRTAIVGIIIAVWLNSLLGSENMLIPYNFYWEDNVLF